MYRRSLIVAVLAVVTIMIAVAAPVFSTGNLSGNQQYGYCTCHGTQSSVTVTMESSPRTTQAVSTGQTVTVWANVSGTIGGQSLGALIASNEASSGSLPSQNGWTILSDPSGTSTKYNYYKVPTYTGNRSFNWTLSAPATAGTYPLYARVLHTGANEYTKGAGPLIFNIQQMVIGPPQVHITSPNNGATVFGTIAVSVAATPGSGQTISYVSLRVDGVQVGNDTTSPYFFSVFTTGYSNGPHVLNVTGADAVGRKGYDQISVTVNNAPTVNPIVVIISPVDGAVLSGNVTVGLSIMNSSAISSVLLRVDTVEISNKTSPPYEWVIDTNLFSDGHHTINATATDAKGRRGYTQISVSIHNAPSVTITSPTAGATYEGTITVNATVTGGASISYVQLWVNGTLLANNTAGPYSWKLDTSNYANGELTINVTTKDSAGRFAYQEITVIIDNVGQDELLARFVGTIIAGSIGLVALISVLIVAVLFLRGKRSGGI